MLDEPSEVEFSPVITRKKRAVASSWACQRYNPLLPKSSLVGGGGGREVDNCWKSFQVQQEASHFTYMFYPHLYIFSSPRRLHPQLTEKEPEWPNWIKSSFSSWRNTWWWSQFSCSVGLRIANRRWYFAHVRSTHSIPVSSGQWYEGGFSPPYAFTTRLPHLGSRKHNSSSVIVKLKGCSLKKNMNLCAFRSQEIPRWAGRKKRKQKRFQSRAFSSHRLFFSGQKCSFDAFSFTSFLLSWSSAFLRSSTSQHHLIHFIYLYQTPVSALAPNTENNTRSLSLRTLLPLPQPSNPRTFSAS